MQTNSNKKIESSPQDKTLETQDLIIQLYLDILIESLNSLGAVNTLRLLLRDTKKLARVCLSTDTDLSHITHSIEVSNESGSLFNKVEINGLDQLLTQSLSLKIPKELYPKMVQVVKNAISEEGAIYKKLFQD